MKEKAIYDTPAVQPLLAIPTIRKLLTYLNKNKINFFNILKK